MTQPRNFSMAGAVDLGARQAAAKRMQQGAQGPSGGGSGFVFDVTEATFNTDVVGRSQSVPVIVDLWAEWCEPCKQLSPVLERLATEAAGDWVLAKVDVDANPQLSAALQVQSIPMVVAVIGGQLVDGFLGALPEAQVSQWIGQILQIADQVGMTPRTRAADAGDGEQEGGEAGSPAGQPGPGGPALPEDPAMQMVREAMERGDLDGAAAALEDAVDSAPGDTAARALLAQVNLIRRVNGYDQAKVLRAASERPDDPVAQSQAADLELALGQVDEGLDRMLGLFQRATGADREAARVHLLSLFEILPPRDPSVARARARLSSLLF